VRDAVSVRPPRAVDIRQLADVGGGRARDDRCMEIRIRLDQSDPPAGRLHRVVESGAGPDAQEDEGIGFQGWLGLLRALDQVIGSPEGRAAATD
jgi:hypothetical protein